MVVRNLSKKFNTGLSTIRPSILNPIECIKFCLRDETCSSVSFSYKDKKCHTSLFYPFYTMDHLFFQDSEKEINMIARKSSCLNCMNFICK